MAAESPARSQAAKQLERAQRRLRVKRPEHFIEAPAARAPKVSCCARPWPRRPSSIAAPGALNGLAQTLLRMTVPGVPDLYQGNEYWDFSLVDPDNRRPVDYASRQQARSAR